MTPEERVADFQSRVDYSPDSVYHHRLHGWRYIPIHPFADEADILERLELTPASCVSVDAYWEIDGEVVLLEVMCGGDTVRAPGIYLRTRPDRGNNVHAILADTSVTRTAFEDTMEVLYRSGRLLDSHPEEFTRIGDAPA